MACLDMYNNNNNNNTDNKPSNCAPMSPRISFSNDFVDTQQQQQQQQQQQMKSFREAPVSTDFEFSVANKYSIISGADELFFKGRLLPFNTTSSSNRNNQMQRTIRDELLVDDDEEEDYTQDHHVPLRPPKVGSMRWKGLLGLKRNHIGGTKKVDKFSVSYGETSSVIGHESYRSRPAGNFVPEEVHVTKSSQELLSEGGSSNCIDVEIGI